MGVSERFTVFEGFLFRITTDRLSVVVLHLSDWQRFTTNNRVFFEMKWVHGFTWMGAGFGSSEYFTKKE